MINFHPDDNLLVEFSAGTLDTGLAIAVKAHISMCPKCQENVRNLNHIGASLFHTAEQKSEVDNDSTRFASLMQNIRKAEQNNALHPKPAATENNGRPTDHALPKIVQRLLPEHNLKWKRVSPSLKQANLESGQSQYEVCLHKIRKGGKVAEHDHRGREATVVLRGSFSDENGNYKQGDFLLKEPGQQHRPTAAQDQDCLCLSVCEAPVKLTGMLGKVLNPFLPFRPA